jgi:hypothetical protein
VAQITIDDVLVWLDAVKRAHGGSVPLWVLTRDGMPALPAWAKEPDLVPAEDLHLSESVPGCPAIFVVGLGAALRSDGYAAWRAQVAAQETDAASGAARCLGCGCTAGQPCAGGCTLTVVPEVWCTQCVADVHDLATHEAGPCPYCGEDDCEASCPGAIQAGRRREGEGDAG